MSDRCFLSITCRKADAERLQELLGDTAEEASDEGEVVLLTFYEANYGFYDERTDAADKGIPWIGQHGDGSNYGEANFVCDGKTEMDVMSRDGAVIICVLDNGSIDDGELVRAREFLELRKTVQKLLGQT